MIDLRYEILSLGNDMAARAENLLSVIRKNQWNEEEGTGLLKENMDRYMQAVNV